MNKERAITVFVASLILIVGGLSFWLSYGPIKAFAINHEISPAWALPIIVDLFVVAADAYIFWCYQSGRGARLGWAMSLSYTALSVCLNVWHTFPNVAGVLLHSIPPITLFLAFLLFMRILKMSVTLKEIASVYPKRARTIIEIAKKWRERAEYEESRIAELQEKLDAAHEHIRDAKAHADELQAESEEAKKLSAIYQDEIRKLQKLIDGNQVLLSAAPKLGKRGRAVLMAMSGEIDREQAAQMADVHVSTIGRDIAMMNGGGK